MRRLGAQCASGRIVQLQVALAAEETHRLRRRIAARGDLQSLAAANHRDSRQPDANRRQSTTPSHQCQATQGAQPQIHSKRSSFSPPGARSIHPPPPARSYTHTRKPGTPALPLSCPVVSDPFLSIPAHPADPPSLSSATFDRLCVFSVKYNSGAPCWPCQITAHSQVPPDLDGMSCPADTAPPPVWLVAVHERRVVRWRL